MKEEKKIKKKWDLQIPVFLHSLHISSSPKTISDYAGHEDQLMLELLTF